MTKYHTNKAVDTAKIAPYEWKSKNITDGHVDIPTDQLTDGCTHLELLHRNSK